MRKLKTTSIIIVLSVIVFQFQNCGSPPDGFDDTTVASSSEFNPGLVDDLPNKKLVFVESLIVTKHDQDLINYDGLCSRDSDGKQIEWVLEKISDRSVALEGQSECSRGGFRISADKMLDIECNQDYELIPFMGEFEDKLIVRRKCDPIASFTVQDNGLQKVTGDNPNIVSRACFFELEGGVRPGLETCHKTCYVSGKLYSRLEVEMNYCSE